MPIETIVLDPSEVADNRTELDLTSGPIDVAIDGIDWGDAQITEFAAEASRGEIPVDYRLPNRTITIPLRLKTMGGTTFLTSRANLEKKVGTIQREGGWLKRVTGQGGTLYMDLTNASLKLPGGFLQAEKDMEPEGLLTLTAIPDFYEAEVSLSDHTETSATELVFTETSIQGDYPARVRVVVDEDDAEDQRGLIWSFRSRHYSADATAATKYEAESLTNLDTTADAALSGASGGSVATHSSLSTSWTPVLGTNYGGTYLTHTGLNRVYARVYSTSGTTVQTRFVWDVGDLTNPTENETTRLPGGTAFYIVDYGQVRLDPSPVGTHRWQGIFQAKGDAGAENFSLDRVWIVNEDEGAGQLVAPLSLGQGLATYTARSEFNTESGALNGDSLAVGGTWTTAGTTTDFSVAASVATRTALTDSALIGRYAVASATAGMTNTYAKVDVKTSTLGSGSDDGSRLGLLVRYVDANNFFRVFTSPGTNYGLAVEKRIGGAGEPSQWVEFGQAVDQFYTLTCWVTARGTYIATISTQGSSAPLATIEGYDSTLVTGGTLDDGSAGFSDWNFAFAAATRTYDNFAAWVPPSDAVMFSSQSCQLTTQGMWREDTGGTAYGPVSNVYGDLPRLPVAGLDGRTTEVFLKASRGDLDQLPDAGIDDISAQVNYSPSWLFAPD